MSDARLFAQWQAEVDRLSPGRYTIKRKLGSGAYGAVVHAVDHSVEFLLQQQGVANAHDSPIAQVALKRVSENIMSSRKLVKRISREVALLAHFKDDNVVGLRDVLLPPAGEDFRFFWFSMELMGSNLESALKLNRSRGLTYPDDAVRYLLYQALRGLKVVHSAGVIHRDLTPANLLVDENCFLKVCDFGLAKPPSVAAAQAAAAAAAPPSAASDTAGAGAEVDTPYVTMRWYRAPEVVMEHSEYTAKLDVWSLGCIFAELLGSRPICTGRDHLQQLDEIIKVTGTPTEASLATLGSSAAQSYVKRLPPMPAMDLSARFPDARAPAINLLRRMLQLHPNERIGVTEAMRHPYFEGIYTPEDEDMVHVRPIVHVDEAAILTLPQAKQSLLDIAKRFLDRVATEASELSPAPPTDAATAAAATAASAPSVSGPGSSVLTAPSFGPAATPPAPLPGALPAEDLTDRTRCHHARARLDEDDVDAGMESCLSWQVTDDDAAKATPAW